MHLFRSAFFLSLLVIVSLALPSTAHADTLTITYDVNQNPTVAVSSAFTVVTFTGFITNNSDAPVTFQLFGGPVPFEPFVASFVSGVPFPGETLAGGASTGIFDIAIVTTTLRPESLVSRTRQHCATRHRSEDRRDARRK